MARKAQVGRPRKGTKKAAGGGRKVTKKAVRASSEMMLKRNPTKKMLLAKAVDIDGETVRFGKLAVQEAANAAVRFARDVVKGAGERMGKTKTLKDQKGRDPLAMTLESMDVHLDVNAICSSARLAGSYTKNGKKRSKGVTVSTVRKLFAEQSLSKDMKIKVANLIDAYLQRIGQFSSMIISRCGKRKTIKAADIAVALQLMHM